MNDSGTFGSAGQGIGYDFIGTNRNTRLTRTGPGAIQGDFQPDRLGLRLGSSHFMR
jgi:hypothetical protein